MRMYLAAIVLIAAGAVASPAFAQKPVDYRTAYKNAQAGDKPLLVLVTAEWCPPCQVMKKSTIPQLMKKKAFSGFHYSTVDLDKDAKLARQLIGERGVPQLIMYEKEGEKWVRRYLRGAKTPAIVEAFVAQAGSLRTASAKPAGNVVEK